KPPWVGGAAPAAGATTTTTAAPPASRIMRLMKDVLQVGNAVTIPAERSCETDAQSVAALGRDDRIVSQHRMRLRTLLRGHRCVVPERRSLWPAAALVALSLLAPAALSAASPIPRAGFTAAVRADAAESTSGQNEPQVTVDASGTAFVTWQSGENGSDVSKTSDGVRFTYLGYPDPATPNSGIGTGDIGDVA